MNKTILKYFLLLVFGSTCYAQVDERPLIEVQALVDTSVITIGDRILYSIIIDRKENLRIERPGAGQNLGIFEIKDYQFHEPEKYDGRIRERFDFSISMYDTGRYEIPPFPVAYFPADTGSKFLLIEASAIEIFVESVLSAEGENELKDVKPPLEIPFNYWFWISMAACVILLALMGYIGYRLWKKRKEQGYLFSPPPPPIPAHIRALEELRILFDSDLQEKNKLKEYFIRLSEIIRTYLEGRYEVFALEETTLEIMKDIKDFIPDEQLQNNLLEVLSLSDLVKFAKHQPDNDQIKKIELTSVDFVEKTKPIFNIEENEQNDSLKTEVEEIAAEQPVTEEKVLQIQKAEE